MLINWRFLISFLELFLFHSLILIPGSTFSFKKKKRMNWLRFIRMKEIILLLQKGNSFLVKTLFSISNLQIQTALLIVIIFYRVSFHVVRFLKIGSGKIY